jgi:large subunit ribosomal protein L29
MADKTPHQALRGKSEAEIGEDVKKLREQLFRLRWQSTAGSLENPNKIREVRRSIARHLTVLGERKRAGAGGKP